MYLDIWYVHQPIFIVTKFYFWINNFEFKLNYFILSYNLTQTGASKSLLWISIRGALGLVLCPPVGIVALVMLYLGVRARRRARERVGVGIGELEKHDVEKGSSHKSDSEEASRLLAMSSNLATFAIIYGVINYLVAGIVFGLITWKGTLGYREWLDGL